MRWTSVSSRGTGCGGLGGAGGSTAAAAGGRAAAVTAIAVAALLAGTVAPSPAAGRVALVIGNSAYTGTSPLANPVNDASDMASALHGLGFAVVVSLDADEAAMDDALGEFEESSDGADVALVFYAGHGLEMNGSNYLVPVDARLATAGAVERETVSLSSVLDSTMGARTRIVILDACRNNPFARSMRGATRANVRSGGLAAVSTGEGLLVAYAAGAGEVAADGEGSRNSPYTSALLRHLGTPGVDVRVMLGDVGGEVRAATGDQQPFIYASLTGQHYLAGAVGTPVPAEAEAALGLDASARRAIQRGLASAGFPPGGVDGVFGSATRSAIRGWQASRGVAATGYLDASAAAALRSGSGDPSGRQENLFWESIQSTPTAAKYEAYLSQYPNGAFAVLARLGAEELRGGGADAPRPRPAGDPPQGRRVGEVFRDCAVCPEMVVVPAGAFTMGSPASEDGRLDDEGPLRRVTIPVPLAVGVHEVTFAEWDACVSAGGCGGYQPADRGWGRGSRPVINVSWEDAQGYLRWLSTRTGERYRLLSESEWEYVARAGTTTAYWWGASDGRNRAHCYGCASRWGGDQTAPVGSFRANAFGLHDVSGNVWEWVEDCRHEDYRGAPTDGSAWTSGGNCGLRVLRGGSWLDYPPDLRSANRNRNIAGARFGGGGFRVSRTLD